MAESIGQERPFPSATEPTCRLMPLAEALAAGEHPPVDCLGTVACSRCLGVFEVDYEPGGKLTIEKPGHVSCKEGLANHDNHHLEI